MAVMSQPLADVDPAHPRRRWPWVAGVVALVLLVAGGGFAYRQHQQQVADDAARALATKVAAAITAGAVSGLPFAGADGPTRQTSYAAAVKGLGKATTTAQVKTQSRDGETAHATVTVRRVLPGGATWSYELPVTLAEQDGRWAVPADQRLVHSELADGQTLRAERTQPDRADVLGAGGQRLVTRGAVVDVGIRPGGIEGSVPSLTKKVAGLVGVEAAGLNKRVQAAG